MKSLATHRWRQLIGSRLAFAFLTTGKLLLFLTCCLSLPTNEAGAVRRNQRQDEVAKEIEITIGGTRKVTIPDLVLRDHEGRKVRFYSDLIKDKIVVLTFFYTHCSYTCSLQGRTLSKLQSLLGERLGKSVFLISVSTDPENDNPAQLRTWGKHFDIHTGWTLVTGERVEMNKLLIQFTGNEAGRTMHLPITFIGNDQKGIWTSAIAAHSPEDL